MFSCRGKTTIRPLDDGDCRFELRGDLVVDPKKVPGVPRFLGKRVQGPLERFIVNAVRPNLTSIALAVRAYLDGVKAKEE